MRVKEHITINGETFSIEGKTTSRYNVSCANYIENIFDHYDRPSQTKIAIWRDWCDWACECGARLDIASHNCFRFTIKGYIEYNGKFYNLYITDQHNRAYEVV